tara:strand:+ start:292 stop:1755 length:1464 start_codon:yes stop_codon:yes gene_type:complete
MTKKTKVALVSAPYRSYDHARLSFGGKHPTNGIRVLGGHILGDNLADEVRIIDGSFYNSLDELTDDIEQYAPDVLGLPCYTDNVPEAIEILNAIDGPLKIVGGPYATGRPQEMLQHADIVFLREAETGISQLFGQLKEVGDWRDIPLRDVNGIAFQEDTEMVVTPNLPGIEDLDSISNRGWELVKATIGKYRIGKYRYLSQNFMSILSSRGCNLGCLFCSSNEMHGRGIRYRSVESVEDEIDLVDALRAEKGLSPLESIKFDDDDVMGRDIDQLAELFGMLARKGLTYTVFATIKYATDDKIKLGAETGMRSIFFGIETHEGRRKQAGKGILTDDMISQAAERCREYGVRTSAGYIVGFPWETMDDVHLTIDTAVELPIDYPSLNILTIHPETILWSMREKDIERYPDLQQNPFERVDRVRWPNEPTGIPPPHPTIPNTELAKLKTAGYVRAYTDPERLYRLMDSVRNAFDATHTFDAINGYLQPNL